MNKARLNHPVDRQWDHLYLPNDQTDFPSSMRLSRLRSAVRASTFSFIKSPLSHANALRPLLTHCTYKSGSLIGLRVKNYGLKVTKDRFEPEHLHQRSYSKLSSVRTADYDNCSFKSNRIFSYLFFNNVIKLLPLLILLRSFSDTTIITFPLS